MGQKIHPTGFRLSVTRAWASRWYASNRNFAGMLAEDRHVREYLKKKLKYAAVSRILIERPELVGGLDPFAQKIGVAPDGQALLIATKLAAGGDLLEVALDGSVQNRTQFAPPLRIGTESLHLGPNFGAVVTGRGFVRFARTAGAQAQLVQLAGGEIQPVYFNALASSINGEWKHIASHRRQKGRNRETFN